MSTLQVANLVFESTANNRIQYIGSNTITITTAGNEDVRIDASGNVGIGTSSPLARFHVVGGFTAFQYNSGGGYPNYNNYFGAIATNFSNGGSELDIWNTVGSGFAFRSQTNTSTQTCLMYIGASGNVGIGTTSSSAKLEVNGNIKDSKGDVRDLPINNQTTAYVTVAADSGKTITTTANVTVNGAIFTTGQAVSIYNNSASSITILPGTGVTMYLGGSATTGNRTLAQRGVATALMVASNTFVISGAGLS